MSATRSFADEGYVAPGASGSIWPVRYSQRARRDSTRRAEFVQRQQH
jgi:hypothetical protein